MTDDKTGLDKKTVLNIRPAFLIVPASLELKAEQLVAQNLVPAQSGNVVPQSIRTLSPIAEPRLDAASETAWYLAASPNQIDTIEYAYPLALAQSMAMNILVVLGILYLFHIRNQHGPSLTWVAARGTPTIWACVVAVTHAQFAITHLPPLQALFGTAPVPL